MSDAYAEQRAHAKARGIPWRLTRDEWMQIWFASGKFDQRGRLSAQYCMARHQDKGAYEVGNVSIKTNRENLRESERKNKRNSEDARGVNLRYPGRTNGWFASAGKVNLGYHPTFEAAKAARDAYVAVHGEPILTRPHWRKMRAVDVVVYIQPSSSAWGSATPGSPSS